LPPPLDGWIAFKAIRCPAGTIKFYVEGPALMDTDNK
jgi:hypothetical protein